MMAIVVALAVVVLILIAGSRVSEYQRRSAQRSLESERKIALATLETINDSVFTLNASGEISYVNPAGEAMINKGSDVIIGSDIKSAIPFADEKSCSDGVREIESKLITGEPATLCEGTQSQAGASCNPRHPDRISKSLLLRIEIRRNDRGCQ